jgi:hypothetical protein
VTAEKDVQIATKTGDIATADRLEMKTVNGKRQVELIGQPYAKLQQKENTMVGPVIRFEPDTNQAAVVGAGAMHVVQEPTTKPAAGPSTKKPIPIEMTWAGNLKADGNDNIIDITDKIALLAKTSDGAINNASADKLHLTLVNDPKATTRPATTQKSKKTDSPLTSAGFGDTNFFKDKLVDLVQLQQNVVIKSVLNDDQGQLLRRLYMEAPLVQYQMQQRIFSVPVPGQMLVQDVSKPDKSDKSNPGGEPSVSDIHGATAFKWYKLLKYDELNRRVTMAGDVLIVHDSGGDNLPFRLLAQTIVADLEPVPTTQRAATQDDSTNQKMRLKHVTASELVEFISQAKHFEASSVDYDPNTHMLVARGTERARAELYDDKGDITATFLQLRYNTQTGQIVDSAGMRGTVRK